MFPLALSKETTVQHDIIWYNLAHFLESCNYFSFIYRIYTLAHVYSCLKLAMSSSSWNWSSEKWQQFFASKLLVILSYFKSFSGN